jgi:negative regulator of flagellin synthesis FlgM
MAFERDKADSFPPQHPQQQHSRGRSSSDRPVGRQEKMQIYGPSSVHAAQGISAPHATRVAEPQQAHRSAAPQDELSISDVARFVDQANQLPEVRADRVASIRAQIAEGTYLSEGRLDTAIDRLLDEIG